MTLIYELCAILTLIFIEDFHRILNRFHRYRQNQTFNIFIAIETSLCAKHKQKFLLFLYIMWSLLTCISSSSSCFRLRISISCFCCSGDISVYQSKCKMRTLINMKHHCSCKLVLLALISSSVGFFFQFILYFRHKQLCKNRKIFDKTMTYRFV